MKLKVKLTEGAPLPRHAKPGDAGLDLATMHALRIAPGETVMVHTGVWVEIPEGWCGLVLPRSGVASKHGLAPVNAPGLIDSGYRGEILVPLHNYAQAVKLDYDAETNRFSLVFNHDATQYVEAGERIAQLVLVQHATCECVEVEKLDDTERGSGGFGSTGFGGLDA